MAMGLGLTYACAARNPGLPVRSEGELEGSDEMEGVVRVLLMLEGETSDCSDE